MNNQHDELKKSENYLSHIEICIKSLQETLQLKLYNYNSIFYHKKIYNCDENSSCPKIWMIVITCLSSYIHRLMGAF